MMNLLMAMPITKAVAKDVIIAVAKAGNAKMNNYSYLILSIRTYSLI